MNVASLLVAARWLGEFEIELPVAGFVAAGVLIFAPHYWLFVKSERFREIAAEFEDDAGVPIRSIWPGWIYAFGSPVFFFVLLAIEN